MKMLLLFAILLFLLIAVSPIAAVIVGARAEAEMRKIMDRERGND